MGGLKYYYVAWNLAEFALKHQNPKGYWPHAIYVDAEGKASPADPDCRIQDAYQFGRFQYLLATYNITQDERFLKAALRNADYLLSIQNENGSWPDWWKEGTNRKTHRKDRRSGRGHKELPHPEGPLETSGKTARISTRNIATCDQAVN